MTPRGYCYCEKRVSRVRGLGDENTRSLKSTTRTFIASEVINNPWQSRNTYPMTVFIGSCLVHQILELIL